MPLPYPEMYEPLEDSEGNRPMPGRPTDLPQGYGGPYIPPFPPEDRSLLPPSTTPEPEVPEIELGEPLP